MINKKTREFVFLVGNNVKQFGVFGNHWEFHRVGNDFVFDGDGGGWIYQFCGDEKCLMFYREVYGIL